MLALFGPLFFLLQSKLLDGSSLTSSPLEDYLLETGLIPSGAESCSTYPPANTKPDGDLYLSFVEAIDKKNRNPCSNFYKYACHDFDDAHKYQPNAQRYGLLQDKVDEEKKKLVWEASTEKSKWRIWKSFSKDDGVPMAVKKMIKFRDYCMKKNSQNKTFCFKEIEDYFYMVVDYLYLQKHWVSRPKAEIDYIKNMVENIINSFDIMLDANKKWLLSGGQTFWTGTDPETKEQVSDTPYEHAKRKLKNMKRYVGGYPDVLNCWILDLLYKDVNVDTTLEYNRMRINLGVAWSKARDINYKDQATKEYYREMTSPKRRATNVNAHYASPFNTMIIYAAILQRPFFDINFPDAVNYGRMGQMIGHEITHGFDNRGHELDVYGSPNSWMDGSALKKFEDEVSKVKQPYETPFAVPVHLETTQVRIDGTRTLRENIADQGGLRIGYHALLNLKERRDNIKMPDELLGNFHMKDIDPIKEMSKIYFTSYATRYCDSKSHINNEKELVKQIEGNDGHSPSYARVNVVLGNSEDFAEIYGCYNSQHERMIPPTQVTAWTY